MPSKRVWKGVRKKYVENEPEKKFLLSERKGLHLR